MLLRVYPGCFLFWLGPMLPTVRGNNSTIRIYWTTDIRGGPVLTSYDTPAYTVGFDGPWQAPAIDVGRDEDGNAHLVAVWPGLGWITRVLTPKIGGSYTVEGSARTVARNVQGDVFPGPSDLFAEPFSAVYDSGDVIFDNISFWEGTTVNATIFALSDHEYRIWEEFPDGTDNYTDPVGTLGLGVPTLTYDAEGESLWEDEKAGPERPKPLLLSLKSQGEIESPTVSVHMGSAPLRQPGSMILGGYEQHRALGPVGAFSPSFEEYLGSALQYSIIDILFGTQTGESPFHNGKGDEGSIAPHNKRPYQRLQFSADLSYELPYIYLPDPWCEAIADRLPLIYLPTLDLFQWNTSNPDYERIIMSSAHLSFVFEDRTFTNLTIKVPFRLLNLTLEAPMATTPISYFPCKTTRRSAGYVGILGRAFLQAAFFVADFEHNITYLAQAPGPDLSKSKNRDLVRTFRSTSARSKIDGLNDVYPNEEGILQIQTNPIEEFDASWGFFDTSPTPDSAGDSTNNIGGVNLAAIVGGSVGSVAVIAVAVAVWIWYIYVYKQRNNLKSVEDKVKLGSQDPSDSGREELDIDAPRLEADSKSIVIHEAPEEGILAYAELPGCQCQFRSHSSTPTTTTIRSPDQDDEEPAERTGETDSRTPSIYSSSTGRGTPAPLDDVEDVSSNNNRGRLQGQP